MHETDSYIDLIDPIKDSPKAFIDSTAYISYNHKKELRSQMCQNDIQVCRDWKE